MLAADAAMYAVKAGRSRARTVRRAAAGRQRNRGITPLMADGRPIAAGLAPFSA